MRASLGLFVAVTAGAVAGQRLSRRDEEDGPSPDCPAAGPDFPPPSHFANSTSLSDAIAQIEALLANDTLGLQTNDTAFGIALFSAKENTTLYERYYTRPIDVGVEKVDRDSIFRIASVSKVFTVWSFLIEAGDGYFNDPITKFVPELANLTEPTSANGTVVYDDLDEVRWEDVTLGNLASQAAGIPRDATFGDLSAALSDLQVTALGLPTLDESDTPVCGADFIQPACTREQFFPYLLKQHPIFHASHSPAYSNIAFTLLGYALQNITGNDLNTTVTSGIFEALGMNHSSFMETPSTGGVIPVDAATSGWDGDMGIDSPGGSVYMSTGDIVKAGQAILQSTLLTPAQTRRWFKPLIQTGHQGNAVGAPWEITYLESPNGRLNQYYTKQGDLGAYHSAMVLSADYEIGWVVLAAGAPLANTPVIRETLMNAFDTILMPAVEKQAKLEAMTNFNGTYVDTATNSSVTLSVGEGNHTGIGIVEVVSRGVQLVGPESPFVALYGAGTGGRLYPSQLKTVSKKSDGCDGTYTSRLGFRAVYFPASEEGTINDPCLNGWASMGAPIYGQRTLDDWVFELGEDGKAEAVDFRLLRVKMQRQD